MHPAYKETMKVIPSYAKQYELPKWFVSYYISLMNMVNGKCFRLSNDDFTKGRMLRRFSKRITHSNSSSTLEGINFSFIKTYIKLYSQFIVSYGSVFIKPMVVY